jgi:hypothetical protein
LGYPYQVGCGSILWKSKKQATVSLSSTKAEYKAILDSCKEGLWLRCLMAELHLRPKAPIPLHMDNSGAEALVKNPQHHLQTKHIHAMFHFVCECVKDKKFTVLHISTHVMLANTLTKPLPQILLEKHQSMIGLV